MTWRVWKNNKNLFRLALYKIQAEVISRTKALLPSMYTAIIVIKTDQTEFRQGKPTRHYHYRRRNWTVYGTCRVDSYIVLLSNASHVQAVLRFRDRYQLPPLAISNMASCSEFWWADGSLAL